MLTMLLGGLWHGASWTFVLWGFFHGAVLVLYRILGIDEKLLSLKRFNSKFIEYSVNILAVAVMFTFTLYGWLIFRANTMDVLVTYTQGLFNFNSWITWDQFRTAAFYILPLICVQCWQLIKGKKEVFWDLTYFAKLNLALFVICCIVFLQPKMDFT